LPTPKPAAPAVATTGEQLASNWGGEQFPYDHPVSGMQPEDMNHDNPKYL
jgi:hypothetical protein